jgi:hypothetical protein
VWFEFGVVDVEDTCLWLSMRALSEWESIGVGVELLVWLLGYMDYILSPFCLIEWLSTRVVHGLGGEDGSCG